MIAAARCPARSEPANSQFERPVALGRRNYLLRTCRRDVQPDRHGTSERPRSRGVSRLRARAHRRPSGQPARRAAPVERRTIAATYCSRRAHPIASQSSAVNNLHYGTARALTLIFPLAVSVVTVSRNFKRQQLSSISAESRPSRRRGKAPPPPARGRLENVGRIKRVLRNARRGPVPRVRLTAVVQRRSARCD